MGEESSNLGEGLKDNVRETKKVFVCGTLMKPEKKEHYVAYLCNQVNFIVTESFQLNQLSLAVTNINLTSEFNQN